MTEHQTPLEKAVVESLIPEVPTFNSPLTEQEIVGLIQQLWPSARRSGKALGEQLFNLRELCRDKEAHLMNSCSLSGFLVRRHTTTSESSRNANSSISNSL